MSQPEVPPSAGLIAGKYQLIGLIGRGGMGSVWEARHASLGTRYAIKFIESEYVDSKEARTRFEREARAAATIESKHAIRIYDHGLTNEGKPYIVMELLQGEPLDKRIDRMGRLGLQDTARIIQQVARGLARAHEKGIIHRDLKPENIFLVRSPDEDDEIAKVLDFGIAKDQNSVNNPAVTSSTKTGAVLGTPFYMSPEQARGLRSVDHRTDVWSLGVIAFKCITGKLPFDGESVGDLLVKICTSPVPVPSQIVPGLPPSFDAWFMRALEREPDRRFSSVQELADALAFTAGISTGRGAMSSGAGQPQSALSTVGVANPPIHTPAPGYTPLGTGPNATARTPQPTGMTGAPFTSAVPGVPASGRGKGVLLGALAGLLVVGLGASAFVFVKNKKEPPAVGMTPPPPASTAPLASVNKPLDPTPPPSASVATPSTLAEPLKPGAGAAKIPSRPASAAPAAPPPSAKEPPVPTAKKPAVTPPPTPTKPKAPDDPGY